MKKYIYLIVFILILPVIAAIHSGSESSVIQKLTGKAVGDFIDSVEFEGNIYYKVKSTDTRYDSGDEVCAAVGKECIGYRFKGNEVCKKFHPNAREWTSTSGDLTGTYCDGIPQNGICSQLTDVCLTCPACTNSVTCYQNIGGLYREMYVECEGFGGERNAKENEQNEISEGVVGDLGKFNDIADKSPVNCVFDYGSLIDIQSQIENINFKLKKCPIEIGGVTGIFVGDGNIILEIDTPRKDQMFKAILNIKIEDKSIAGISQDSANFNYKVKIPESQFNNLLKSNDPYNNAIQKLKREIITVEGGNFLSKIKLSLFKAALIFTSAEEYESTNPLPPKGRDYSADKGYYKDEDNEWTACESWKECSVHSDCDNYGENYYCGNGCMCVGIDLADHDVPEELLQPSGRDYQSGRIYTQAADGEWDLCKDPSGCSKHSDCKGKGWDYYCSNSCFCVKLNLPHTEPTKEVRPVSTSLLDFKTDALNRKKTVRPGHIVAVSVIPADGNGVKTVVEIQHQQVDDQFYDVLEGPISISWTLIGHELLTPSNVQSAAEYSLTPLKPLKLDLEGLRCKGPGVGTYRVHVDVKGTVVYKNADPIVKRPFEFKFEIPVDFECGNEIIAVPILVIDGVNYPSEQFSYKSADDKCKYPFWDADEVKDIDSDKKITNPDPKGCGFGFVDAVKSENKIMNKNDFTEKYGDSKLSFVKDPNTIDIDTDDDIFLDPPKLEGKICGPDVTDKMLDLLTQVYNDYNSWKPSEQKKRCNAIIIPGLGSFSSWDIDELSPTAAERGGFKAWERDCSRPDFPCGLTVELFGECVSMGLANYMLWGVMNELCDHGGVEGIMHWAYDNFRAIPKMQTSTNYYDSQRLISLIGRGFVNTHEYRLDSSNSDDAKRKSQISVLTNLLGELAESNFRDTDWTNRVEKECKPVCKLGNEKIQELWDEDVWGYQWDDYYSSEHE